jgi:hypothetical protein
LHSICAVILRVTVVKNPGEVPPNIFGEFFLNFGNFFHNSTRIFSKVLDMVLPRSQLLLVNGRGHRAASKIENRIKKFKGTAEISPFLRARNAVFWVFEALEHVAIAKMAAKRRRSRGLEILYIASN